MSFIKAREEPPGHLKLILLLVCLTYFSNCFFLHVFRTMAVFFAPFMSFQPSQTRQLSKAMSYLYLPTIFLGIFAGQITDKLTSEVSLIIFSIIASSSVLFLYLIVYLRSSPNFIFLTMLIYGTGQNLSKIPMQKITAILFQGPHLALAVNITQLFSHLAGIVASRVSLPLMRVYGVWNTFLIVFVVSSFSVPLCLFLREIVARKGSVRVLVKKEIDGELEGEERKEEESMDFEELRLGRKIGNLYSEAFRKEKEKEKGKKLNSLERESLSTLSAFSSHNIADRKKEKKLPYRDPKTGKLIISYIEKRYRQSLRTQAKLKKLRKKNTSVITAFKMLFYQTHFTFFLVLFMALLIDGCQVSFKNIESFVYKGIFGYNESEVSEILSLMKSINILTPLSSVLVDIYTVRQFYFVFSTAFIFGCHLFFYFCIKGFFMPSKFVVMIVGSSLRLVFSLFHAAFYSFVAVILKKEIKGFGFGFVYSVLSVGYVIAPMIFSAFDIEAEKIYVCLFFVGFLVSLSLVFVNARNGNVLNKDKRRRRNLGDRR